MSEFQVLCTTMFQTNFDKIKAMNIHSDVLFANQTDSPGEDSFMFEGYHGKMISTTMRGVGNNRNIALMYAEGKICLMADDDMKYCDDYKQRILNEFEKHPEADVIIFNIGTSTPEQGRIPTQTKTYKRFHVWSRNPYGAPRIAFRLEKVRKKNIYFSTYFGGGCVFKTGEDTIWLEQLRKAGLRIFISPVYIGDVSYQTTTSYIENNQEKLYTKGAELIAENTIFSYLKIFVYAFIKKYPDIHHIEAFRLLISGVKGYQRLESYQKFLEQS